MNSAKKKKKSKQNDTAFRILENVGVSTEKEGFTGPLHYVCSECRTTSLCVNSHK